MLLTDFYPNPDEMIGNEIKTVKFFSEHAYIQEYPAFHGEATRSYNQYRNRANGFSFASHFDLFHKGMPGIKRSKQYKTKQNSNVRLVIAASVEQKANNTYGNISYALAVCRLVRSKRSSILRKFHFDITTGATLGQSNPICHLQYCGEMLPVMDSLGYRDEQLQQLHTKVREPRLFFPPMSLALLVDLAVREFGDPTFREFLLTPEWRNLVRQNETLVLKRFYEKCAEVINMSDRQRRLLADEFYLG